ncbi:MAG: hypothetical protein B7Z37_28920 [Verrucomicrobia bacterium 12-59-8]|nr:MAG: hypothetical protein B7Z37_28920 [Verrucomicrobia bacterium 12-59-8]
MMQQTVLLTCVRGPDGMPKYSSPKYIVRWLRRSILLSATDGKILTRPGEEGGGSFTGPSLDKDWTEWEIMVKDRVDDFVRDEDCIPGHFMDHVRNASQILGFKHPDLRIRAWWRGFHLRLVNLKHLHPETEEEMDKRLGDTLEGWKERGDAATER